MGLLSVALAGWGLLKTRIAFAGIMVRSTERRRQANDRLFAPSEVEAIVMVPVLGTVPRAARRGKARGAGKPPAKQGLSRA